MISADNVLNARILIVDDEEVDVLLLERALHSAGYTSVSSTMNPNEVCELHRLNNYDLILLDLEMQGMDGFEVMEGIKTIEVGRSLPVLVITAHLEHKLRALQAGAKDFISKPFELMEVLARVQNMIEVRLLYTEAKDYTQRLERLLKEMEANRDLITLLNTALMKKSDEDTSENLELESYSHSVSHDLRAPLRLVNRIAYKLLDESGATLSANATAQMNMILQATEEMGQLIERLLTFSQATREPMKLRHVELRKLFQAASKELKYEADGRDVEIVIQDLPSCVGDRTLLKEVVENLLENAFKFAQRREKARITVGSNEVNGEIVYFVKDNGAGFDKNLSDSLFIPFKRLHDVKDFKGTGIGLALVKRIIERHGGQIWAEGIVDEGATFYFTLGKKTAG